jgi:hypothetical protein
VEPHGHSPWHPSSRPSGATSPDYRRDAFIHGQSPWLSAAGVKSFHNGLSFDGRRVKFIRLRRRPRALPVDECVSGVCANPEPRYHCFGGFRHWRITLRSLGACAPNCFGAQGRRRVFLWRYHGLSPWGSIALFLFLAFIQIEICGCVEGVPK